MLRTPLAITIETSGDPAPALGSPPLLLQLTTNLVHKAIVHNSPGDAPGEVWVRTDGVDGVARLAVENTGPELPATLAATLAEPFRRGTERVRSEHAGVGLGLAIVDSIALAHGGPSASNLGGAAGSGSPSTCRRRARRRCRRRAHRSLRGPRRRDLRDCTFPRARIGAS